MKDTDLALLQRFTQAHDADAFSQIVARYQDFVYSTCVRVLDDPVGAEDAAQECFMKLLQKADAVRSSLAGWLHDCATGISIDAVRRRALRKDKEEVSSRMNSSANNDNRWHNVSPHLDKALEELPDDLRVVVVEHFLQRRTQTEIARQLGVSPATVSRRVDSGIEQLRKKLKKAGVIVSAAVLASLIAENAVIAAPAALTATLGKVAIAGAVKAGAAQAAGASWEGKGTVTGAMTTAGKVKIATVVVAALAVGWVVAQEIADNADLFEGTERIVLTRGEKKVIVNAPDEVQAFLSAIALVPKEQCKCDHLEQVVFQKGEEKLSASICGHCLDIRTSGGVKHYEMPKPFYDLFQKHMRPKDKEADKRAVVEGNNVFAFDLYAKLKDTKGNLFLSPFSISTALGMTSAGARGNTATQMAKALHFELEQRRLHPALGALAAYLQAEEEGRGYRLHIANALWGQEGSTFLPEFLDLTQRSYNAGLRQVDFRKQTEQARRTINDWVEEKTQDKIKELLKPTDLSPATRLVLTNAIYFLADWAHQFKKRATRNAPFTLTDGDKVDVPTMHQTEHFRYGESDGFQALELPYKRNELSIIIFLPKKADGLADFEKALTAKVLAKTLADIHRENVSVALPKFEFTAEFKLGKALQALGMIDAFNGRLADFSGMTGRKDLFISKVIHKAFVKVDEKGTEAAAATAVVMEAGIEADKPKTFRADHPFLFLIRENKTGAVLFIGRVLDPRG